MCVRAFSGSAGGEGGGSFVHGEQGEGGGAKRESREGGMEGRSEGYATDGVGGWVEGGTSEETQPLHLDFFQHREQ